MTPCKKLSECKLWRDSIIVSLVLLTVATATLHIAGYENWSNFRTALTIIFGTGAIVWSLWVVKTFYSIVQWWQKMHADVDTATRLLKDARLDLKDIKQIAGQNFK